MPVCSLKDNDFDFSRLLTVLTADGERKWAAEKLMEIEGILEKQ
jgi:hypothetical protein